MMKKIDWVFTEGGLVDGETAPDVWVFGYLSPAMMKLVFGYLSPAMMKLVVGPYTTERELEAEKRSQETGVLYFRMKDDFGKLDRASLYDSDVRQVFYYPDNDVAECTCSEFFTGPQCCRHTKIVKLVVRDSALCQSIIAKGVIDRNETS